MGRILQPHIAAVAALHVAGDGEAEPDSGGRRVARRVEPDEGLEHPVALRQRDPGPVIVDEDIDPVFDRYARQPDMLAVTPGVGDQVGEAATQGVWPD